MAIPTALHSPIGGLERCTRPTIVRVVVIHVGLRRPRVRLFPDPERSLRARVFSSAPRHLANRSRASSWGSRAGRPLRDSQLTAGASGTPPDAITRQAQRRTRTASVQKMTLGAIGAKNT